MPHPLTRITPTLWVAQSRLYAMNSGLWVSAGAACLIDPGIHVDELDRLVQAIATQGVQVTALVLTHSHWDHILGPERFPGVPVVAQAGYRAALREAAPRTRRVIADMEAAQGRTRAKPFAMPQPDQTFMQTTTLPVGDLRLRLTHAPGHAADQLTVYDPASGTLWAADMLSDQEIPFVSHSLPAYRATLATLAGWDIQTLVPGHGAPTGDPATIAARLGEDRAYLDELAGRISMVVTQGGSLAAAVAACAEIHLRHPAANAEPHRFNIESAYAELGGAADPAQVGWSQEA
ncbi:MAG: MBL fold metallo-hydrolase [Chloroflexota bacterium]|nr:MBL fold metallo-hydrolase [Chloroflexota bacterium]